MNREIKFRAYSNQADKIMEWEFIKSVGNLTKLICLNHVDVMQYTGLKDKNGKEIYEGDIIKHGVRKDGTSDLFIIQYMQARFKALYKDREDDSQILGSGLWEDAEVIGNIYENAELLTTQAGGVNLFLQADVSGTVCELREWKGGDEPNLCDCGKGEGNCKKEQTDR